MGRPAALNRRHLIRETWNDRNDRTDQDDIHHSGTVGEKLSLVNRFGITIGYTRPMQREYLDIVRTPAERNGIRIGHAVPEKEAVRWEMSHGGISGRTAQQFIDCLAYRQQTEPLS